MTTPHPFNSKGIFAWQLASVTNVDPAGIAALVKKAGFESIYLKVADGIYPFNPGCNQALVDALHAAGIAVVGWGFLYGTDWRGEAQIAASQVNRFGLDGYIWDVESAYEESPGAAANAANILATFRASLARQVPTALCSWAYFKNPSTGSEWHPLSVARAWLQGCEFGMPMEYWQDTSGAADYLSRSLAQWRTFTDRPIIPVGRAYTGDGGTASAASMKTFEQQVRKEGCHGISWWGLDWASNSPEMWSALSSMLPFSVPTEPLPNPYDLPPKGTIFVLFDDGKQFRGTKDEFKRLYIDYSDPLPDPDPEPEPTSALLSMKSVVLDHAGPDAVCYQVITADPDDYELVVDDSLWCTFPHLWMQKTHCQFATNGGAGWYSLRILGRRYATYIYGLSMFKGKGFGKLDRNWGQVYVDELGVLHLQKPAQIYTTFPYTNLLVLNGELQKIDKAVDYRARTAIGQRADGKIVLLAVDGGDYNRSHGMSFQEVAQLMKDLDCVLAVMLDGGGSTCMAQTDDDGTVLIVGTPSGEDHPVLNGITYNMRPVAGHIGLRRRA